MDKTELAQWMKEHRFADLLRQYAINALGAKQLYEPFEDLVTKGKATVDIYLTPDGLIITLAGALEVAQAEEPLRLLAPFEKPTEDIESVEQAPTEEIAEALVIEPVAPKKRSRTRRAKT